MDDKPAYYSWADRERLISLMEDSQSFTEFAYRFYQGQVGTSNTASLSLILRLANIKNRFAEPDCQRYLRSYATVGEARTMSKYFALALLQAGDEYECAGMVNSMYCGQTYDHYGRLLPLAVDHIDGDPCNSRLSNLRFLCPNCHSLAPTSTSHVRVSFAQLVSERP